jgi:uncharacterized protein with PIN domain
MKQIPPEIESRIVYKTRKNADDEAAAFPVIEKLKPVELACDDCNNVVVDRRTEIKVYAFPERHWREYCTNCKKFKNPESGKFEVSAATAPSFFRHYVLTRDK